MSSYSIIKNESLEFEKNKDYYLFITPDIYVCEEQLQTFLTRFESLKNEKIHIHGHCPLETKIDNQTIYYDTFVLINRVTFEAILKEEWKKQENWMISFAYMLHQIGARDVREYGLFNTNSKDPQVNYHNLVLCINDDSIGEKKKECKNYHILLYVIYHNESTFQTVLAYAKCKWAYLIKIQSTKYFETDVFTHIDRNRHEWRNKEYVGQITYAFSGKTGGKDINSICNRKYPNDVDVITFLRYNGDMLSLANQHHPGSVDIMVKLCTMFGINVPSIHIPVFYCNYWMSKPEWMNRYLELYFRSRDAMETNEEIRALAYKNSTYYGKMTKEDLIRVNGVPWYTQHPFVMERLPCLFFYYKDAKIFHI